MKTTQRTCTACERIAAGVKFRKPPRHTCPELQTPEQKKRKAGFLLRKKVIMRELKKIDELYLSHRNPYTADEIKAMSREEAIELCTFIKPDVERDHIKELYTKLMDAHGLIDSDFDLPE